MAPTMLPFLYQTRTLCSRALFRPASVQARRLLHISSAHCGRRSSASIRYENRVAIVETQKQSLSKLNGQLREDPGHPRRAPPVVPKVPDLDQGPFANPQKNGLDSTAIIPESTGDSRIATKDDSKDQDEIPFLSLPDSFDKDDVNLGEYDSSGQPVPQSARDSTITIRERLAFDHIFADIMARSKRSNEGPRQESSAADSQYFDTTQSSDRARRGLDTEDSLKADTGNPKNAIQLPSSDTRSGKDSQDGLRIAVDRYPQALRAAAAKALGLAPARSPQILEEEEESHEDEHAGNDKLEEMRQRERQRVENLMRAAATDAELWQIMEKEVFPLVIRLGFGDDNTSKEGDATLPKPKPLDCLVYGPLYPSHLLLGIRLLDRSFLRPSPLVLNVLPRIKSLGVISHVLGASTAFYNELLRINWSRYDDFLGVLKLLDEMEECVLEFDEETLSIINEINHMQVSVRRGDHGPSLKALWSMPEFAPGKFKAWRKKIQSLIEERDSDFSYKLAD